LLINFSLILYISRDVIPKKKRSRDVPQLSSLVFLSFKLFKRCVNIFYFPILTKLIWDRNCAVKNE